MGRLTLVRLLLVVILINILLTGLFVLTAGGNAPWFESLLPGTFGFGTDDWGNYVFLSLALLINAVLVLGTGFVVLLPAMFDREAKAALEEIDAARWIFRIGALLFVIAVPLVLFTFARAEPDGRMFTDDYNPVANSAVSFEQVALFTVDQAASAVSVGAPELFGLKVGPLDLNRREPWMPPTILAFRIIATLTFFLALLAATRESTLAARMPAEGPSDPGKTKTTGET